MASAAADHPKLTDDEYKNWLKIGLALLELRDGLCSFTDSVSKQIWNDVLQKYGARGKSCTQCEAKELASGKKKCPTGLCDKLLREIKRQKGDGQIYWTNTDITKWTSDAWEIAKVFMGTGQTANNQKPADTDASNLLTLMKCKYFEEHLNSTENIQEVIDYRNKLMHSANLRMTPADVTNSIKKMILVLKDIKGMKDYKDATAAVDKLKKVEDMTIDLRTVSSEMRDTGLLMEKMRELENRCSSFSKGQDKITEELEKIKTLVQQNGDYTEDGLRTILERLIPFEQHVAESQRKFEQRLNDMDQRVTDVDQRVTDVDQRVTVMDQRVTDVETQMGGHVEHRKNEARQTGAMNPSQPQAGSLPKLCNACRLNVADQTLDNDDVIELLGKAGTSFCSHLTRDIMPRSMQQRIQRAEDDDKALGILFEALEKSENPYKLEKVLKVLRGGAMGKTIHANKIESYYHEEWRKHTRCEECYKED